ncbi:MAG: hypothetical protein JO346_03935, partial [Alphaproteobacteria bacterium]|nr:hypothetical protein [Alphaproteobacteria bacterium]
MPRYFFDVIESGRVIPDPDGSEMGGPDEAISYCRQSAREILAQRVRFGDRVGNTTIRIRDSEQATLCEIAVMNVL